jgi:DNA-binding NarL/FixJ family response regulator
MLDLLQKLADLEEQRVVLKAKAQDHLDLSVRFDGESKEIENEMEALMAELNRETISAPSIENLSRSERIVLGLIERGLTHKEIGVRLGISERTSKFHIGNIYKKLGIDTSSAVGSGARILLFKKMLRAEPEDSAQQG